MQENSKNAVYSLIIGICVNVFTTYLFAVNKMSLGNLMLVLIGSLAVVMIINIKDRTNKIIMEQENQKLEQKKLGERLKIHEQLIDIKAELKELQKKVFKNGK